MNSRKVVLGTVALLLIAATGRARAEKQLPISQRSPDDQNQYMNSGLHALPHVAAIMDQEGNKLSDYGRWGFVEKCLDSSNQSDLAAGAVAWALCGDDLKALDLVKLKESFTMIGDNRFEKIERLKKEGAALEEEAKSDPGLKLILTQVDAAKAEWKAFEAKNHDAIVLYQKLKDGVRTSKSNDKNFDHCWEVTQPPFAKAVKATKFSWDNEGDDAVAGRVAEIVTNPAAYYSVANFGMCAYATHETGAVLADAMVKSNAGIFGWRTMLIAKLLDPKLKPKFSDRSLSWNTDEHGPTRAIRKPAGSELSFPWSRGSMAIHSGMISKMKKDGDDTVVSFKGRVVDGCLKWVETKKLRTWDTAGDPVYERICKKRGKVEEDAPADVTFGTKFTEGFAPGVGVAFIGEFPVEAYDGKKFVAILGVSVKGSPAETPRKE